MTVLRGVPAQVEGGGVFSLVSVVRNRGSAAAKSSTTRYYLSKNRTWGKEDLLLGGSSSTPWLKAWRSAQRTVSLSVPATVPLGYYYVIARADAANKVRESNETNNALASSGWISVRNRVEITGIEPASGKPGDRVTLHGKGFDPDPAKNFVSFAGVLGPATVEATTPSLEVIVPEGALSGKLTVSSTLGSAISPAAFVVARTITLSPALKNLIVGSSTAFSCHVSGVAARGLVWTLNGSITADPALGTLTQTGQYTAPDVPPDPAAVTVRCASAVDATLFEELQIAIVEPVAVTPGSVNVTPENGGQVAEENGFAALSVPPDAVSGATQISIAAVNPATLPTDAESVNLAAVTLEPTGTQFDTPVTLTFTLPGDEPPGSLLPLYVVDEGTGTPVATGQDAVVDASGLKAAAQITHFSTFVVRKAVAPEAKAQLASTFSYQLGQAQEFFIYESRSIPLTEGLSVPVAVKRIGGWGIGWGPFSIAVGAVAVLSGYEMNTTPLSVGPVLQPSRDGWEIGTVITIPTIRGCGTGQTIAATLVVWYPDLGTGTNSTIRVPFSIQCLDELEMSGTPYVRPSPVPAGTVLIEDEEHGRIGLKMLPGQTFRFSQVAIGPGAVLHNGLGMEGDVNTGALQLDVTGDVIVSGEIRTRGSDGSRGEDGAGADSGGAGGRPGVWHGGAGGRGGPATPDERRGRSAAYGGLGGDGGLDWQKGSWIKFAYDAAQTIYAGGRIVASEGTDVSAYYDLIENSYHAKQQAIKIYDNKNNQLNSAGGGGYVGLFQSPSFSTGTFVAPRAGGGGGGSGKMIVDYQPDAAGAGGGGGGGAGPTLRMSIGGRLLVNPGGLIDGRGGNGGQGGNGAGTWDKNQAAPGGGGAGGTGAAIQISAMKGVVNNGRIIGQGGIGGLSGELNGDAETVLVDRGFGELGHDGALRIDGPLSGNAPERFWRLYDGPVLDSTAVGSATASYCLPIDFKDATYRYRDTLAQYVTLVNYVEQEMHPTDTQPVCFRLSEGFNLLSVRAAYEGVNDFVDLHPWWHKPAFFTSMAEDADGDGLWDRDEARLGTSLTNPDSDGDGITDGGEVNVTHTDPLLADTDGDGFSDFVEVQAGSRPTDPSSTPEVCDGSDNDRDGSIDEGFPDHDSDGLKDCLDPDDDNDGLLDVDEIARGTDPFRWDTDGDGYSDPYEVAAGTNPLDPNSYPRAPATIDSPEPEAGAAFGFAVATIEGAGLVVSAPFKDVGGNPTAGRVYYFDALTGALIRTFDHPDPATASGFGYAVSAIADMDGDGLDDVVIASPFDSVVWNALPYAEAGRVFVFSSGTGQLLRTYTSPNITYQGRFGMAVAAPQGYFWKRLQDPGSPLHLAIGATRLLVGEPAGGTGGRVYAFGDNAANLIYTLTSAESGANFGLSVSLAGWYGEHCGEAPDDYGCVVRIGAPLAWPGGKAFTASCNAGGSLSQIPRTPRQPSELYGQALSQLDVYSSCGNYPAHAESAPLYDEAGAVDAGTVDVQVPVDLWEVTYAPSPRRTNFQAIHPQPQGAARFGSAVLFLRDQHPGIPLLGAGLKAVCVAAPGQNVASNAGQGLVYLFNIYGDTLGVIASPNPQGGAHFGSAMTALATAGGRDDYLAVSAPDETVAGLSGQGRVYIFETGRISKTDTDRDGLFDAWEAVLGTDPNNPDTDGDGRTDWDEVYVYKSDPLHPAVCGNNILEPGEQCDGTQFPPGMDTCEALGNPVVNGTPGCYANCTFNLEGCACHADSDCIAPLLCLGGACVIF